MIIPPNDPITKLRYERTLRFILSSEAKPKTLLDIGGRNPFTEVMEQNGFTCFNTDGDLDQHPEIVKPFVADAATSFEIFEHLLNPFSVLKNIPTERIFVTVPLALWFDKAYRNPKDQWDQHFHEFEDWQFDWLMDASGWKIIRREHWNGPIFRFGFRPLLRRLTPRFYAVEAVRKK